MAPSLADRLLPQPTNAERDGNFMLYGVRDRDVRWSKYPGVRVVVMGREDDWGFIATRDDGSFVSGSDFNSPVSARQRCERKIKQNVWQTPLPRYRDAKRAEIFGPIGQPSEELAKQLAQWDAQED